eukprot:TRINITY_DN42008_c0_g1_i1.p1 TRINITY_DN42008_c0_g1~~TRINITY_DN42008_c0_g1_i1.p1  ORF type:complete len:1062 (+),score=138.17 TRINITY_DN42008_c0_g1_i1:272-3457(+)
MAPVDAASFPRGRSTATRRAAQHGGQRSYAQMRARDERQRVGGRSKGGRHGGCGGMARSAATSGRASARAAVEKGSHQTTSLRKEWRALQQEQLLAQQPASAGAASPPARRLASARSAPSSLGAASLRTRSEPAGADGYRNRGGGRPRWDMGRQNPRSQTRGYEDSLCRPERYIDMAREAERRRQASSRASGAQSARSALREERYSSSPVSYMRRARTESPSRRGWSDCGGRLSPVPPGDTLRSQSPWRPTTSSAEIGAAFALPTRQQELQTTAPMEAGWWMELLRPTHGGRSKSPPQPAASHAASRRSSPPSGSVGPHPPPQFRSLSPSVRSPMPDHGSAVDLCDFRMPQATRGVAESSSPMGNDRRRPMSPQSYWARGSDHGGSPRGRSRAASETDVERHSRSRSMSMRPPSAGRSPSIPERGSQALPQALLPSASAVHRSGRRSPQTTTFGLSPERVIEVIEEEQRPYAAAERYERSPSRSLPPPSPSPAGGGSFLPPASPAARSFQPVSPPCRSFPPPSPGCRSPSPPMSRSPERFSDSWRVLPCQFDAPVADGAGGHQLVESRQLQPWRSLSRDGAPLEFEHLSMAASASGGGQRGRRGNVPSYVQMIARSRDGSSRPQSPAQSTQQPPGPPRSRSHRSPSREEELPVEAHPRAFIAHHRTTYGKKTFDWNPSRNVLEHTFLPDQEVSQRERFQDFRGLYDGGAGYPTWRSDPPGQGKGPPKPPSLTDNSPCAGDFQQEPVGLMDPSSVSRRQHFDGFNSKKVAMAIAGREPGNVPTRCSVDHFRDSMQGSAGLSEWNRGPSSQPPSARRSCEELSAAVSAPPAGHTILQRWGLDSSVHRLSPSRMKSGPELHAFDRGLRFDKNTSFADIKGFYDGCAGKGTWEVHSNDMFTAGVPSPEPERHIGKLQLEHWRAKKARAVTQRLARLVDNKVYTGLDLRGAQMSCPEKPRTFEGSAGLQNHEHAVVRKKIVSTSVPHSLGFNGQPNEHAPIADIGVSPEFLASQVRDRQRYNMQKFVQHQQDIYCPNSPGGVAANITRRNSMLARDSGAPQPARWR